MLQLAVALCAVAIGLTSVRANTLNNFLVSGDLPATGVLTVSVDDATGTYLTVEAHGLPDTTFIMEVLTDTSGAVGVYAIDPTIATPSINYGSYNGPGGNNFNTQIRFQINKKPSGIAGRYYDGVVVFYNPNGWSFSSTKTYKMLFHIAGTGVNGTSSCWVAEIYPPTACTVSAFRALDITNMVYVPTQVTNYNKFLRKTVTNWVNVLKPVLQTTLTVGLGDIYNSTGFSVKEEQTDGSFIEVWPLPPETVYTSKTITPSGNRTGVYVIIDHDTVRGDTVAAATWSTPPLPVSEPAAPNTN